MCIFVYIYIYTYIHTYIHIYIYTYIHTGRTEESARGGFAAAGLPSSLVMAEGVRVATYVYIYIYIYVYIYIYIYTSIGMFISILTGGRLVMAEGVRVAADDVVCCGIGFKDSVSDNSQLLLVKWLSICFGSGEYIRRGIFLFQAWLGEGRAGGCRCCRCLCQERDLSTRYGLRFSTGASGRKRFSTNTYRKCVVFLLKSSNSGNLRELAGECHVGILYSSSLLFASASAVAVMAKPQTKKLTRNHAIPTIEPPAEQYRQVSGGTGSVSLLVRASPAQPWELAGVYTCMCVCMDVCMYVYMYVYVYIYIYIYVHVYMCMYIYIYI